MTVTLPEGQTTATEKAQVVLSATHYLERMTDEQFRSGVFEVRPDHPLSTQESLVVSCRCAMQLDGDDELIPPEGQDILPSPE
jgi:hypothetical protein